MNDTAVKNFLYSKVDRIDRCVFKKTRISIPDSKSLNIGCTSIDIDGESYKTIDSAEVIVNGYVPRQIIEVSAFKTKNEHILFVFEWMEVGAEFDVSMDSSGYSVRLISIDRLD